MNLSLIIGWWCIPASISIVLFSWSIFTPAEPSSGWFPDPMPIVRVAVALIGSLFVWLLWALVF